MDILDSADSSLPQWGHSVLFYNTETVFRFQEAFLCIAGGARVGLGSLPVRG